MLFICYPKCSTCQNAKKWLDENNIEYTYRHIVDENPSYEEISLWIDKSGLDIKKFFNTSGLIYKQEKLKDKVDKMSKEEKIKILSTNGMLLKRPLVIDKDTILVGFKKEQWIEKLK